MNPLHLSVIGIALATAFAGANIFKAVVDDDLVAFLSAVTLVVLAVLFIIVGVP